MPVGGRINRRDNLRSKKALTKSKADKDVNSKPFQENASVLRNVENLKRNNVDAAVNKEFKTNNDAFVSTDKSELIVDTLRSFYIYLEDINITENVFNINYTKEDKVSNLEDHTDAGTGTLDQSKLKSNIPKRKTKNNKNYPTEECALIIEDIMESSEKNNKIETENDKNVSELQESEKIDVSKITEKPENTKRKGRPRAIQTVDSQKEEMKNDMKIIESKSHQKDLEKTDSVKGKNRTQQKKIEPQIPSVNLTTEKLSPMKPQEKRSNVSNRSDENLTLKSVETKEPGQDLTRMTSRLGRKNTLHNDKERTELIREPVEQIESNQLTNNRRKTAARSTRKQIDYSDSKETDSTGSVIPVTAIDSVDLDADLNDAMETDQTQEAQNSILPTETRKAGRPVKSRMPFVIEKTTKPEPDVASQPVKIPGLIMLEKIKNRKSCAIQALAAKETEVKSDPRIEEEKEIPEKQTRGKTAEKKQIVSDGTETKVPTERSKKKKPDSPEMKEIVEKNDTLSNHSEKKSVIPEVTVSEHVDPVAPEPMEIDSVVYAIKGADTPVPKKNRRSEIQVTKKFVSKTDLCEPVAPIVPGPVETESVVSAIKKADTPVPKRNRRPEVQVTQKSVSKTDLSNSAPTKIPGLRMIEDIRRRKSEMHASSVSVPVPASPAVRKTSVRQSIVGSSGPVEPVQIPEPSVVRIDNKETEKVPGLATIKELKSYSRNSIHSLRTPDTSIVSKRSRPSAAAISCADTSVTMDTVKVPGLSATNQLRKQKIAQQTTVASSEVAQPSNVSKNSDNTVVSMTTTKSILSTPSKQVGRSTPVGILCKPSPYKRPISCVTDESGDIENGNSGPGESRRKMARVQTEKRQSVTFNREVEVKEIHGNSFNSISDDVEHPDQPYRFNFQSSLASVPTDQLARDEFQRKLESELERTKHFLQDRRFQNSLSGGRQRESAAVQQIAMLSHPVKPLAKKCSDLSNLISQRAKLTSLSPPRVPLSSVARNSAVGGLTGAVVGNIGASKKVASVSHRNETASRRPDQWKSFRNPVGISDRLDDDLNRSCDDDESMSCEDESVQHDKKKESGACMIM